MEPNESMVIKTNKNKKTSSDINKYQNVKRIFPRIETCWCCCCLSFGLSIKLSTMLLILWFCIVVAYNLLNGVFNISVIIYIIVILSAILFLYGILRMNRLCLKQYLVVFFLFLIYYLYFCFKNIIQALSLEIYEDEIKINLEKLFRKISVDQMYELLDDTKFFVILFAIIPFILYIYYFLACGSYVELIEEHFREELLARELEEDIQ